MALPWVVLSEAKGALEETSRYLLSHHTPDSYHKCYAVPFFGRTIRVCARCLGIYPGIAIGLLLPAAISFPPAAAIAAVAVLPSFALIDWARSAFTAWKGTNAVRTLTGLLLGIAYGLGIRAVLSPARWPALAIGAAYAAAAFALLWFSRRAPGRQPGQSL